MTTPSQTAAEQAPPHRRKPRGRRRLFVGLAVLLALPLLAWGAASMLVPRDRIAAELAARVEAETGAEFSAGEVSLQVLGGLGLQVGPGRLQGTGAALNERQGSDHDLESYTVEFSQLACTLAWRPLLQRRVEIAAVRLVGPRLEVQTESETIVAEIFAISLRDLTLDLEEGTTGQGAAPGLQIPESLAFRLDATADRLLQKTTPWRDVVLKGRWQQRKFTSETVQLQLADGIVSGALTLDYGADPWGELAWQADLAAVPAAPLLGPYLPDVGRNLTCDLDGELGGTMNLRDKETRLASLAATGTLVSGAGVLEAADWLQGVSDYLGQRQDLTTVDFHELTHQFRVEKGRYVMDGLQIDGKETDWLIDGWLGFAGDLDVRIGVRLPPGFTPDLGGMTFLAETLRGDDGRVKLGFKLSGLTAAPRVGLDLAGMR